LNNLRARDEQCQAVEDERQIVVRRVFGQIASSLILLALVSQQGCEPQSSRSGGATSSPAPSSSASISPNVSSSTHNFDDYERSLEQVRTARFARIYVFSRRDGGVFTADDITYLKANAPDRTNQWVKTDGGRKIIAGTNFEFTPENLDAERKRFNVEDFPGR